MSEAKRNVSILRKGMSLSARLVNKGNNFAVLQERAPTSFAVVAVAVISVSITIVPGPDGMFGAGLGLVMLTIAVIDWRHFIIPDALTGFAVALGLAHAAAQAPDAMSGAIMTAAARAIALVLGFLIFRSAYARIRGRQGLGLGDVKLAGVAGAWLEWSMIPVALELAALVALAVYIGRQFALGAPLRAAYRVPFGLFFAPAIWLSWLVEAILPGFW
jgi:leader peptidase (prepilin peptidase)/N-methyltransferase